MSTKPSFTQEISNLLYAADGKPLNCCVQCATCSSVCPAVDFMDHTPRLLIAMINADLKDEVLASNAYWTCASCYACTERCPKGIHPADMMYALKRYSIWKRQYKKGMIGPEFSRRFVRTIIRTGKSYEPGYATAFILHNGFLGLFREMSTGLKLMRRGRLPLMPPKIKRIRSFRRMVNRIMPVEGIA